MNIIHHVGIITNFNRRIVISIHHMDDNIDRIIHVIMASSSDIILYDIISSYMDGNNSRFMFTVNTWDRDGLPCDHKRFQSILSILSLSLIMFTIDSMKIIESMITHDYRTCRECHQCNSEGGGIESWFSYPSLQVHRNSLSALPVILDLPAENGL